MKAKTRELKSRTHSWTTLRHVSKYNNYHDIDKYVIKIHITLIWYLNLLCLQKSVPFDKIWSFFYVFRDNWYHFWISDCPSHKMTFVKIKKWLDTYTTFKSLYYFLSFPAGCRLIGHIQVCSHKIFLCTRRTYSPQNAR